ncbi:MAG: hypothetical protein AAFU85_05225 [Planctomycetota bacterium]
MCYLSILASALFCMSPALAQKDSIPTEVKSHLQSMVGSWTFSGTEGERKFSGAEVIRLTNNGTALLQEGYFDLGGGGKEHYVILSGWDGEKETVRVRGFTSEGYTWVGEWKTLKDGTWSGTASGKRATFRVAKDSMRYEDASQGTAWVSEFKRVKD